jgi:hypothetical protein
MSAWPVPEPAGAPPAHPLWDRCRNSLGIARLLHHDRRPAALVLTACETAVESACRTALGELGLEYDDDVEAALRRLGAPADLLDSLAADAPPDFRLASAERIVAWVAGYLRTAAPGRSWGH